MKSPRRSIGKRSDGETSSELSIDESDESDGSSVSETENEVTRKKTEQLVDRKKTKHKHSDCSSEELDDISPSPLLFVNKKDSTMSMTKNTRDQKSKLLARRRVSSNSELQVDTDKLKKPVETPFKIDVKLATTENTQREPAQKPLLTGEIN